MKWLKLLDESSYGIYLCHCLVLIITDSMLTSAGIVSLKADLALKAVIVYGISLGLCMLYTYIKNKFIKSHLQKR